MLNMLFQDTEKNTVIGELPNRDAFFSVDRRPRETEWDVGHPRSVHNVRIRERMFETVG
jgi:hypothetical protein